MSVPTGQPEQHGLSSEVGLRSQHRAGPASRVAQVGARAELHDHLGRPIRTHPDRAGEQVDIAGLDTARQYRALGAHERWGGGSAEDGQGQRAAGQHRPRGAGCGG
jgi:hypothetical protein